MSLPDAVDVLVIGCGPAGSAAALAAAGRGASVLLADRAGFPRAKACGCCLSAAALAELHALGLGDLPRRRGAAPVYRLELRARHRWAQFPLPIGAALLRSELDDALVTAAVSAGAHFTPRTLVTLRPGSPGEAVLTTGGEHRRVRARVVIAAAGLAGVVGGIQTKPARGPCIGLGAIHPGPPSRYRAGTIHAAVAEGGYVAAVRVADGRLNLAAALDPDAIRRAGSVAAMLARMMDGAGLPRLDRLEALDWRATPMLTRRPPRVAGERLLLAGDAAGDVEPFTGEGIARALRTGRGAGELAGEAALRPEWDPAMQRRWIAAHRRLVGARALRCGVIARLLRHPTLAAGVVALLGSVATLPARAGKVSRSPRGVAARR